MWFRWEFENNYCFVIKLKEWSNLGHSYNIHIAVK